MTTSQNSRVINFRFWDGKKFLPRDSFCLFPDELGGFEARGIGYYGVLVDLTGKLQQSTGLLDKNGKEIYEGDLVQGDDGEIPDCVYFENGCFWVDDQWLYGHNESVKVIGNIYETPDLCSSN